MNQTNDRAVWLAALQKIALPVLENAAAGTLAANMPVECAAGQEKPNCSPLEGLARTLCGVAPWLECTECTGEEERQRQYYAALALQAIEKAVDPTTDNLFAFACNQRLVEAAFLAQGILRAPRALLGKLTPAVRKNLADSLRQTRAVVPYYCNWLFFSGMVEAMLCALGEAWDAVRVEYVLRSAEKFYQGDGFFGDGERLAMNYYNSFVMHPMFLDMLAVLGEKNDGWRASVPVETARASRYASVLERMIAPDGSYPPLGRSLAYRFGAFHALAQAALQHNLGEHLPPNQVRSALTAVIERTLTPGTFDDSGWLRIGFCGAQPGVGEYYIRTGSLYLCTTVFLPLGLAPSDPFWAGEAAAWTSKTMWSGGACELDHVLAD
ncbi:MAG: DUF2264 domain-containing protein [Oscillospiraceae bacterium]|jgi:hypothetical protein|nr:DUF2264 domain-containing protein [Oscillospiraceae bacterium]